MIVKRFLPVIFFLAVFAAAVFIFRNNNQESFNQQAVLSEREEKILLGYCPTMKPHALEISISNSFIETVEYDTTADVLTALNSGMIDLGLVGRKAKEFEINPAMVEKLLTDGYTLIGSNGGFIDFDAVDGLNVYTTFDKEDYVSFFPPQTKFIIHDNLDNAVSSGGLQPVLILWSQYRDDHNLIIPMKNGKKIAYFRSPFIYCHDGCDRIMTDIDFARFSN